MHNFSVPIKKKVKVIGKTGEEIAKSKSYVIKIINCTRFMLNSLSTFINKVAERTYRNKYKCGQSNKICV